LFLVAALLASRVSRVTVSASESPLPAIGDAELVQFARERG